MEINTKVLWIWIKKALGYNNKKTLQLVEDFGSVTAVYESDCFRECSYLSEEEIRILKKKKLSAAWEIYGDCKENNIGILTLDDPLYPPLLAEIDNPPALLFYKGRLRECLEHPIITVVGTRKYNGYGEQMTREFVSALTLCDFTIACGVADGVDTFACETALQNGGRLLVFLPFGILSNKGYKTRYFPDIIAHGALISEIFPRIGSHRFAYHERNRTLSGIAEATLVTQAPERSGALMTAHYALDQNRDLFVVMANANMTESAGSNQLIKNGCYPVTDFTDILKVYLPRFGDQLREIPGTAEKVVSLQEELAQERLKEFQKKHLKKLLPNQQTVFLLLGVEERSAEDIIEASGLPVSEVLQCLTALEFAGLAVSCPGGKFKVIL